VPTPPDPPWFQPLWPPCPSSTSFSLGMLAIYDKVLQISARISGVLSDAFPGHLKGSTYHSFSGSSCAFLHGNMLHVCWFCMSPWCGWLCADRTHPVFCIVCVTLITWLQTHKNCQCITGTWKEAVTKGHRKGSETVFPMGSLINDQKQ
jgi:hypothetical protein